MAMSEGGLDHAVVGNPCACCITVCVCVCVQESMFAVSLFSEFPDLIHDFGILLFG